MNKKWPGCEIFIPHFHLIDFNKLCTCHLTNRKTMSASFTMPPFSPITNWFLSRVGKGKCFFFFPFIAIFQGFYSLVILSPQIISGLWQRSRYNTDLECWMKGLFLVQPEENNWSPSYAFLPHHNSCPVGCFTFARSWLIANVSIWYLHAYSELCIC